MANGRGGYRPGSGRKPKAQDLELHGILSEAWPNERRRAAFERLAALAEGYEKNSVEAAKLLLAYTYGKPIDRKEISGPDGEPLKSYVAFNPVEWDKAPSDE